jgi:outer membrane protein assembly factor BamB
MSGNISTPQRYRGLHRYVLHNFDKRLHDYHLFEIWIFVHHIAAKLLQKCVPTLVVGFRSRVSANIFMMPLFVNHRKGLSGAMKEQIITFSLFFVAFWINISYHYTSNRTRLSILLNQLLMKKTLALLAATILLSCNGCRKETDPEKDSGINHHNTAPTTILDIKWKVLFRTDTTSVTFLRPMFHDNYVVFCTNHDDEDHEYGIGVFDKLTGARHPSWQQSYGNMIDGSAMSDWTLCGPNNRIAVLYEHPKLFAYDIATGQQIWQHSHTYTPTHQIYGSSSSLYHPNSNGYDLCNLMRFHPETGISTKIWSNKMGANFESEFESVYEWVVGEKGYDTVLLFLHNGYRYLDYTARTDAYAYSLTKKQVLWSKTDIFKGTEGASVQPVMVDNKVIFQAARGLVCFNATTGDLLWRHTENKVFFPKWLQSISADGKLFVRYHAGVMAFDVNTGAVLWITPPDFDLPNEGAMDYYNGKLYFTGNKDWKSYLYCLLGASGGVLWKEPAGYLRYGVIIDQPTGNLYISDGRYIYCIDLNTTPKY